MSDASRMIANIVRLQTSNMQEATILFADAMRDLVAQSETTFPTPNLSKEPETSQKYQKSEVPVAPQSTPQPKTRTVYVRPGHRCSCTSCGKDVYQITIDVYDDMPILEFIETFAPIGHEIKINPEWPYQNIDGCMMTRCPLCRGDDALVLWGRKPEKGGAINLGQGVTTLSASDIEGIKSL